MANHFNFPKVSLDKINSALENAIDKREIAGALVLAFHNNEEIFYTEKGYSDIADNKKINRNTIFRLFSMTKPITAVCALQLVDNGLLSFDDIVSDFIPSLKDKFFYDSNHKKCKTTREITIFDLLNMTSGITYPELTPSGKETGKVFWEVKNELASGKRVSTYEFAHRIGECSLAFDPGKEWLYGTSADIMGAIIEKVSGMSFGDYIKKNITQPLNMDDTGFWIPEEKYNRLSEIYIDNGNGLRPFNDLHLCLTDYKNPPSFESGGAGLVSTIDDYAKFALALLNKDNRILSDKMHNTIREGNLNEMQLKTVNWDSMRGYNYGYFMRHMVDSKLHGMNFSNGEFGWDGWTGNYFTVDPERNVVYLYFIQKGGAGTTELGLTIKSIINSVVDENESCNI